MNIDNLDLLIERLEACKHVPNIGLYVANKQAFNLSRVAYPCGSPACVAGHCGDLMEWPRHEWDEQAICDFLGVTHTDALRIFSGDFSSKNASTVTVDETVEHLEELRDRYTNSGMTE